MIEGTYFIGRNPPIEIPVRVVSRKYGESVLVALADVDVSGTDYFWGNPIVRKNEIVDTLGACSFFCKGIDPRTNDGGPSFLMTKFVL